MSHKSSSSQSALVDFGRAIDAEEPPAGNEDRNYLETQFMRASAASPPTITEPSAKQKHFVPTEILMDDSTIQIIQTETHPDEDTNSRDLGVHNTCPEHSEHLPYIRCVDQTFPTQTIQSSFTAHLQHSSVPLHCPIPIRPVPSLPSVPFDSISYHMHNTALRPPAADYVSSTKSSPRDRFSSRTSSSAGRFPPEGCSRGMSMDDAKYGGHMSGRHMSDRQHSDWSWRADSVSAGGYTAGKIGAITPGLIR